MALAEISPITDVGLIVDEVTLALWGCGASLRVIAERLFGGRVVLRIPPCGRLAARRCRRLSLDAIRVGKRRRRSELRDEKSSRQRVLLINCASERRSSGDRRQMRGASVLRALGLLDGVDRDGIHAVRKPHPLLRPLSCSSLPRHGFRKRSPEADGRLHRRSTRLCPGRAMSIRSDRTGRDVFRTRRATSPILRASR